MKSNKDQSTESENIDQYLDRKISEFLKEDGETSEKVKEK